MLERALALWCMAWLLGTQHPASAQPQEEILIKVALVCRLDSA